MRINIYDEDGGGRRLAGWFDPDLCEAFEAGTDFDGNSNKIDRLTGQQCTTSTLYRTRTTGRWVEEVDARSYFNGGIRYRFLADGEAREWLLVARDDAAVTRFWGEPDEESGPDAGGRPEVGGTISTALGTGRLAAVDQWAADNRVSRAEAIRQLLDRALGVTV